MKNLSKPIAALAIWFAIVFIFTALFTSISLLTFERDKTGTYSDTEIEYMGKKLADERFAEPLAEVNAENEEVAAKVASAVSIATAFESDFNTYLVKTDSTVTNVNSLNSDDDVSGAGTQDDPYIVKTLRGWLWIENLIQYTPVQYRYITLAADIDFDGYILDIVAMQTNCFVGIFDGAGFTFKNVITKCSLFSGVGSSFGESGITAYEKYNNEIKNLNADVIMVSSGGEMPNAFLAGVTAYNTKINNCKIDQFSYDDRYAMSTAAYLLGGVEISDCYFNIRTKNGFCCVAGYAISNANLEIETTNQASLVDNCVIDVNIHTSIDSAGTIVVGTAFGAPITVSNCKAYGNYTSTGRRGDGMYMGVYMNFLSFQNGADAYIKNCENYVNCAMYGPIGNLVGSVLANDKDTTESPNGKLYVQNCINYGDAYNTYNATEHGNLSTFSNMSLSGFIGNAEGDTTITLDGCKNYGSQYGGSYMSGFVSNCQSIIVVNNCANFGSMNYAMGLIGGGSVGGIATVSMDKCYNMPERSVIINNCAFVGNVRTKSNMDSVYEEGSYSMLMSVGGICSVVASKLEYTSTQIRDIIIQNCYVDMTIAGKVTAGMSPMLDALTWANDDNTIWTEDSKVVIDNNTAFISVKDQKMQIINLLYDGVANHFSSSGATFPKHFVSTNNYYSVDLLNTIVNTDQTYCKMKNIVEFCNNQISINLTLTDQLFDALSEMTESEQDDYLQFLEEITVDIYNYEADETATVTIKDVNYFINIDNQITRTQKVAVNKNFENYYLNDYSNNVMLTYNSNIEGDVAQKYYYHSDESVEKFGSDKWFYCPELNDGRPMLRQFFHLAKYYTGQDCFARLEELGYTQYVASSGA